jgi:organic radical activating enzyme
MSEENKQIDHEYNRIQKILPGIEAQTSPTFCLAKWHHVTIYLHLGETHSCYHPRPHVIPLEELKDNPSALHNTMHKKLERKQMLDGEKPEGCTYCWNVEALGPDYLSDRKQRTVAIHEGNEDRVKTIVNNPWDMNVNPEYIELSFGNQCNFKCGYCHPRYSSTFFKEIKEFGQYKGMLNDASYDIGWFEKKLQQEEEKNPYVKAWWEWWPEVSKTLTILRITGGEPTIHGSTYRLLDEINKNPMPHLELNINTNLGTNPKLFDRFVEKLKPIIEEKKVKEFKLFTSIDTWDKDKAEYLRTGLDVELFERNFNKFLEEIPNGRLSLMITFNNLVVSSFDSLLEQILVWRNKYNRRNWINENGHIVQRIQMDTPYLKEPSHYDMNILPKEQFAQYMDKHLRFMEDNFAEWDINKFDMMEVEKFKRVHDYYMDSNPDETYLKKAKSDFYTFFSQYDIRRETNFKKTFPEYNDFYNECLDVSKSYRQSSVEKVRTLQNRREALRERREQRLKRSKR